MGGPMSKDWFSPYSINTPLIGVTGFSMYFNSVRNGRMHIVNVYTNLFLCAILGTSNGFYGTLRDPLWGARLGVLGSVIFTLGAPARILFTGRLFPRFVHYGIGGFYCTYHSLQWYKALHYFEDAGEDNEDEFF
ncbi:hypothetical protein ABB37_01273 [Leptomonas pyrrhocoris]|uniref:Uncharacterized protein n=1 Tax=Leptomonas pyrrhocoris TaxID=157538 RepID=A0A0N0DZ31_LEPPY|nr:hypothetical protein ABB37_01273 [Leptomonas pyrrhocoris]KPA84791.1 hypothetical protein ABB37_01273 [Leptomonas pyrrhocoris]|eukprot:XP_015663230.1 hypothetical protein ABB37_01273 [Leptomonas pyrrhocoris]